MIVGTAVEFIIVGKAREGETIVVVFKELIEDVDIEFIVVVVVWDATEGITLEIGGEMLGADETDKFGGEFNCVEAG